MSPPVDDNAHTHTHGSNSEPKLECDVSSGMLRHVSVIRMMHRARYGGDDDATKDVETHRRHLCHHLFSSDGIVPVQPPNLDLKIREDIVVDKQDPWQTGDYTFVN